MKGRLYLRVLRPHQWTKNGFVLAALVFSNNLLNPPLLAKALLAAAAFCLISSATYIGNDLADREQDRQHPRKKTRPIASGAVGTSEAFVLGLAVLAGGWALAAPLGPRLLLVMACYLAVQTLYTLWLKHVVLLDIFAIAIGFVLRAVAGAYAIGVSISSWLILCTLLLALFLGFAKRRHELLLMGGEAEEHRVSLREYSIPLLDQFTSIVTAATIVAYSIYTLSPEVESRLGTRHLVFTIPFVIYGLFRYLYLIHLREEGGSPARTLLTDGPLLLSILLWGLSSVAFVYFLHSVR